MVRGVAKLKFWKNEQHGLGPPSGHPRATIFLLANVCFPQNGDKNIDFHVILNNSIDLQFEPMFIHFECLLCWARVFAINLQ